MKRHLSSSYFGLLAASLILVIIGCGPEGLPNMVPIRGEVIYNGQPLTEGTVLYLPQSPQGRQARGNIQTDGSFYLTTLRDGDGAQQGEYNIVVIALKPHPGEPSREEIERAGGVIQRGSLIPERYNQAETSGLSDVVNDDHPGKKQIELSD